MTDISSSITPEDWFPKYRHVSIELNGDFDIFEPFKNIEKIDVHAESLKIRILPGFDEFGKANAIKCFRKVIECVGSKIEWLTIEMNAELAMDYLDACPDILKNLSGLGIRLFLSDCKINVYNDMIKSKCSRLKILSLHNCSEFIGNTGNMPLLEKLSISDKRNPSCDIGLFILYNKQLKSLNIDNLILSRNDLIREGGLQNLQELRVHNASASFFSCHDSYYLKNLNNVWRLELHNLKFSHKERENVPMNSTLNQFASRLPCFEALKHLTITLNENLLRFYLAEFIKCDKLESLAISAYQLDELEILHFVRYSRNLTTLHLHTYDGTFSNTLIRKIASERAKLALKDQKLALFVGGKYDDFSEVILIKCLNKKGKE